MSNVQKQGIHRRFCKKSNISEKLGGLDFEIIDLSFRINERKEIKKLNRKLIT